MFCPNVALGVTCWKSRINVECPYSHRKEDAPICRRWQAGECIGGRGNNCLLRHYYNNTDQVVHQAKRFQESQEPASSHDADFSSPYRVKVVKEVEKLRHEEHDLETGRRRSWVETKEYDVYDLTGDTPTKPPQSQTPRPPLRSKQEDNPIVNIASLSVGPTKAKEKSLLKTNSSTRPLVCLEKTVDQDTSPSSATCPVCSRQFKNKKGVASHRSHPSNYSCRNQDKENTSQAGPADQALESSSSSSATNSIIIISDTPPVPSRRRSTRTGRM